MPEKCIEGGRKEGKSNVLTKGGVVALAAGTSAPHIVACISLDVVSVFVYADATLGPPSAAAASTKDLTINAASLMTWRTILTLATQADLP